MISSPSLQLIKIIVFDREALYSLHLRTARDAMWGVEVGVSSAHGLCELGAKTKHVAGMANSTGKPSWAKDLRSIGLNYYGGIVTNVDDVLEEHRRETHCTFGTRSSKKLGSLSTSSCQQAETPSLALSSTQQDEKENANPKKVCECNLFCISGPTFITGILYR